MRYYSNKNQWEDYPFKRGKGDLPILDIKVTSNISPLRVISLSPNQVTFSDGTIGQVVSGRRRVLLTREDRLVGHLVLAYINPTKKWEGAWEIIPTCVFKAPNLSGLGTLNDMSGDITVQAGKNVVLEGSLKVHLLSQLFHSNYLKKLGGVSGNHLTIWGREFVRINGNVFSTAIGDPNLSCPVLFSGQGDKGDDGPPSDPPRGGDPGTGSYSGDFECAIPQD